MNYTIRNKQHGRLFEHTVEMKTTRSPFIVMIRLAKKLYPEYSYTSKFVQNLGEYILSVNGVSETKYELVWMFLKKLDDGTECMPDDGVNQYRVHQGEHLILSLMPRIMYNDVDSRCP
ncbi:hypothetical protein NP493_204g08004 [Ridgeia piscesae]|uniref:Uncharacterized protein n=1 Tax=Ridgeia piscesae TaxID=27915 RepID=A0AAD9P0W1_RIDPI|nr:hypothetical protein NP493_204g08004 [Ridgeia piscesae]